MTPTIAMPEFAATVINFKNTLEVSPPTGVWDSTAPAFILLALASAMALIYIADKKRKQIT